MCLTVFVASWLLSVFPFLCLPCTVLRCCIYRHSRTTTRSLSLLQSLLLLCGGGWRVILTVSANLPGQQSERKKRKKRKIVVDGLYVSCHSYLLYERTIWIVTMMNTITRPIFFFAANTTNINTTQHQHQHNNTSSNRPSDIDLDSR